MQPPHTPTAPTSANPPAATFGLAGTPVRARLARGTDLRERLRLSAVSTHPDLPRYLAWPVRPAHAERRVPVAMSLAAAAALAVGVAAVATGAPILGGVLAFAGLAWLLIAARVARTLAAARRACPEPWLAVAIACDAGDAEDAAPSIRVLLEDGRHVDLWTTRDLAIAIGPGDAGVAYRCDDRLVGFWRAR